MAYSFGKCWKLDSVIVQLHWKARSSLLVDGNFHPLNDMTLNAINGCDYQECVKDGLHFSIEYDF